MWERGAREGNVRRPQLRSCTRKSREGLPAAMAKRSAAVAGRLKSPRLPRGSVQWGCIRRTGAALGKAIARVGPPDTIFFIYFFTLESRGDALSPKAVWRSNLPCSVTVPGARSKNPTNTFDFLTSGTGSAGGRAWMVVSSDRHGDNGEPCFVDRVCDQERGDLSGKRES